MTWNGYKPPNHHQAGKVLYEMHNSLHNYYKYRLDDQSVNKIQKKDLIKLSKI